jgi:hypothetical protein
MIVLGVWPLTADKLPALSETGSQQASGRPPVEDRALRSRYLDQSPKTIFIAKDIRAHGRVGFQVGHLGRVVTAKCPKYGDYTVKIEKILGVSAPIAAVSPWISINDHELTSNGFPARP